MRKHVMDLYKGIYHLIQRGNNRAYIFSEPTDKDQLLIFLEQAQEKYDFIVYAYVIMDNHYHLMVQRKDNSLATIMQWVNRSYSLYYNKKYHRSGSIYQGRYAKFLMEEDTYLLSLLKYIHRNPLRAQMIQVVSDYPYSSDHLYRSYKQDTFVNTQILMTMFHENKTLSIQAYKAFVDDHKRPSGPLTFKSDQDLLDYMYKGQAKLKAESLDQILDKVCSDQKIKKAIYLGHRHRHLSSTKITFICQALKQGYSQADCGRFLKLSKTAISKLYQKGGSHGNHHP